MWCSAAIQATERGGGFLDFVLGLAEKPGVVEGLVALVVVGLCAAIWLRLSGIAGRARTRAAIRDYLLGVEQAMAGDLKGACKRLSRVLAQDPENHHARLLYAKVLAESGDPAEAHKHHLVLQRSFEVESPRNDLFLAQSLLMVGRPDEAADAAERAVCARPADFEALELRFRALMAAGRFEDAARAGERALAAAPSPGTRAKLRPDVVGAWSRAGLARLEAGDLSRAREILGVASRMAPDDREVRLLGFRVDSAVSGVGEVVKRLLDPFGSPGTVAPGAVRPELSAAAARGFEALAPVRTPAAERGGLSSRPELSALGSLVPDGRWVCGACGLRMSWRLPECRRCGAREAAQVTEPKLFAALDSATLVIDAVEQNRAFVQRTVATALGGIDPEERRKACGLVLEMREQAVEDLLAEALRRGEDDPAAVELLRAMGPAITKTLFRAARELDRKRILPFGGHSAAIVGRIVQGFDRQALPYVEEMFAEAPPEYRKTLIDYFIGVADLEKFQTVLEWFPPLEILHRLNKADGDVLVRFFREIPEGHFVTEVLVQESAFYREDAVFRAIDGARHPEALERALLRRGPSRTLVRELVGALDRGAEGGEGARSSCAKAAYRMLEAFGPGVIDHILAAFVDEEIRGGARRDLGDLMAKMGVDAVEPICNAFGPEPTPIDAQLRAVIARIGEDAVPALRAAYSRSSLLEKFAAGLLPRHNNRRVQILRALAAIDGERARAAIAEIRARERDPNLRLRIDQILHDAGAEGEEGHGQAR